MNLFLRFLRLPFMISTERIHPLLNFGIYTAIIACLRPRNVQTIVRNLQSQRMLVPRLTTELTPISFVKYCISNFRIALRRESLCIVNRQVFRSHRISMETTFSCWKSATGS